MRLDGYFYTWAQAFPPYARVRFPWWLAAGAMGQARLLLTGVGQAAD